MFRYDFSIGELMVVDPKGEVLSVHQILQTDKSDYTPIGHAPFKETGEGFSATTFQNPYSGMVQESSDVYWIVVRRFDPVNKEQQRVLATYSLKENRNQSRYFIPGIEPSRSIFLMGKKGENLLVFNASDGDSIYSVPKSSLMSF